METDAELQTSLGSGVQFGQGWLLGRPVMVSPPADVGGVVGVAPDWFDKQRTAPFMTTAANAPTKASTRGSKAAALGAMAPQRCPKR